MFERFTDRARRVVTLAQDQAREMDHAYVGTEHLLLGLLAEGGGVAFAALTRLNINLEDAQVAVKEMIGDGAGAPSGHIPFTTRTKKVMEISLREALQLGHNYIGTEHLLLAIVREGEGVAAQVLMKVTDGRMHQVRQSIIGLLSGYAADAKPALTPPILPEQFRRPEDNAEDLAAVMISGLLAGEHEQARRILDGLRQMGWRPPAG